MMKLFSLVLVFLSGMIIVNAQPSVINIDPKTTQAGNEVVISGENFGSNSADIVVWFGGVKAANVVSVTPTSIVVEVPSGAPSAPIAVQKISSGLIGLSDDYFFISHSGASSAAEFDPEIQFANDNNELFDICGCDFDGDGLVDFASTESTGIEVILLLNTSTVGNINFVISTIDATTPIVSIGCADLDGDTKPDLYMTRRGANQNQLYLYRNTSSLGNLSFGPRIVLNLTTTSANPYQGVSVDHGDLTGDGKVDLIVTNRINEPLINVLVNTGSPGTITFAAPSIYTSPSQSGAAGLAIEDIDNDGLKDLILTRSQASDVFIYKNLGGGAVNFQDPIQLSSNTQALVNVKVLDLDGDGFKEIITQETFGSSALIYRNISTPGSPSFGSPIVFTLGDGFEPWSSEGADVNGDGLMDLIFSNRNNKSYSVLINDGALNFSVNNIASDQGTRNIYTGDIDGDAKPDLAFTSLELPTGNFSLQMMRNNNCFQPRFINDQPLAICPSQTLTLETTKSPSAAFSWTLDGGDLALSTSSIDITAPGTYEVTAISESGSCNIKSTFVVANGSGTIPSAPVATNNGPGCTGEAVDLTVDAQAGATYSWTGPNGFTSTDQNPSISNLSLDDAGLYEVTVKIGDCLSSSSSTELLINLVPSFNISATGSTTVCSGQSVSLSTQNEAGFTYQWLKDGVVISGSTNTLSASESGVYQASITETASSCNIMTNQIEVSVLANPVASFDFSSPLCTGSDAVFTNTSNVNTGTTVVYSWDFGDGTTVSTPNPTHTYTSAGNFNVTLSVEYTGITGCVSTVSNSVSVVAATPVNISSDQNTICTGETVDLTVPDTFNSITWSTGQTGAIISVDAADTYTVTAVDNNGCVSTDDFVMNTGVVPEIIILANQSQQPAPVPSGSTVQLVATGADSYLWSPEDFLSDATIANPIATATANITYTVQGALLNGCIGTGEISITVVESVEEIKIEAIKAFNPDNSNDPTWRILGSENYPDCTLSIFDERGSLVYRQTGYNNDWDGTNEGSILPEGIYYYVFSCENAKPVSGTVLLVK